MPDVRDSSWSNGQPSGVANVVAGYRFGAGGANAHVLIEDWRGQDISEHAIAERATADYLQGFDLTCAPLQRPIARLCCGHVTVATAAVEEALITYGALQKSHAFRIADA